MLDSQELPVSFYSRKDRPYGVFSNFSATPIWIGGRRYPTVEHWYQSVKQDTLGEREHVRYAGSPEQAKSLGRELQSSDISDDFRVKVMFRGVWAKFRQHPRLETLLLNTGNRPIHEKSEDRFWGLIDGVGSDWLGRIIVGIRSFLADPTLAAQTVEWKHLALTDDIFYLVSPMIHARASQESRLWLTHYLRKMPGDSTREHLLELIKRGVIPGNNLLGGGRGVCFTARQPGNMSEVWRQEEILRTACGGNVYSQFGIAICYEYAREAGFYPTLPGSRSLDNVLPDSFRVLHQLFDSREKRDYTFEQEWRYPGSVTLHGSVYAIVLPGSNPGDPIRVLESWLHSQDELVSAISACRD